MTVDSGFIALIGVVGFGFALLSFTTLRRVNRSIIALLAISFGCFSVALGVISVHDFQQGVAHVPSGRRTTSEITRGLHPFLFWASTSLVFLCTVGLGLFSLYLFRISLMRRRA